VKHRRPIRVGLVSLGCAKNLVDSEVMLGTLTREGMTVTEGTQHADVIIINTCGFIEGAKREAIETILRAGKLRKPVIVAGCLPQRYPKQLQIDIPEVSAVIGLNEVPRIGTIVRDVLGGDSQRVYWSGPATFMPDYAAPRYRLTPRHWAYVKIAEGCDHPCAFCSIPRIRGRYRSRPLDDVLSEVRQLVAAGTREINLISQDTTLYGPLSSLLRSMERIQGDFRVRLLYTHPAHWTDELIETMAECDKVCRYIDIPLQHINDEILKRMRRETDGAHIRNLLCRIRAKLPGVAVRTAFIVGFPGETEKQFDELLVFIREARFERLGVFEYSQEEGTRAGAMKGQVSVRTKRERYRRVMALQQRVSRDVLRGLVGQTMRVLMESPGLGRSQMDAPEVDGTVRVHGCATVGEFADVRITASDVYDLTGSAV